METNDSYLPEELVEQEGPNKGNISDPELARVGAEVEDKVRSQKIKNEIDYQLFKKPGIDDYGFYEGFLDREDQKIQRSAPKAEKSMQEEVERRAKSALKDENISHSAKAKTVQNAGKAFVQEHQRKSEERVKEQTKVEVPF